MTEKTRIGEAYSLFFVFSGILHKTLSTVADFRKQLLQEIQVWKFYKRKTVVDMTLTPH